MVANFFCQALFGIVFLPRRDAVTVFEEALRRKKRKSKRGK